MLWILGAKVENLIILYNPYYNNEVIEDHVRIFNKYSDITEAKVAFGKVHSARRDYDHLYEEIIDQICESASPKDPIQLFLTDFSSMYAMSKK